MSSQLGGWGWLSQPCLAPSELDARLVPDEGWSRFQGYRLAGRHPVGERGAKMKCHGAGAAVIGPASGDQAGLTLVMRSGHAGIAMFCGRCSQGFGSARTTFD